MSHYRACTNLPALPPGFTMQTFAARTDRQADIYFLVWATHFRATVDPVTERLAALVIPDWIVRVRRAGDVASDVA